MRIVALVFAVSIVVAPRTSAAAVHTVTDLGDTGAAGQLRTLINVAAGGDTILIPPGTIVVTGAPDENANASGDLDINKNLTIVGAGPELTVLDGGGTDRVFDVGSGFTVVIADVTIRNGSVDPAALFPSGGGLLNRGTLTLTDVVVENNFAGGGGGIANFSGGVLLLQGSTVRGNSSTGITANGGGISNFETMTIRKSTISDNRVFGTSASTLGGGIINVDTMTIDDSTISGNEASGNFGGGIFHANAAFLTTLTNVTIAENTVAGHGGGLGVHGIGKVKLKNTIVADNHAGLSAPDCSGTIDSEGYNLIHRTAECTIGGVTTGNILGSRARLQALADNGGPTETHALRRNSPAVDAGDDASCASVDQRGIVRPIDGDRDGTPHCDIGAFELQR